MKRTVCLLLIILLICAPACFAAAEDRATYSDDAYSFTYPAFWRQGYADDGSVILSVPGTDGGVITFALLTNLIDMSGEAGIAYMENLISGYDGSSGGLALNGSYEAYSINDLQGYVAQGTYSGGQDAELLVLSDGGCFVCFMLIGSDAISERDSIAASIVTNAAPPAAEAGDGFLMWQGDGYSVKYPDSYQVMNSGSAVMFTNETDAANNSIFMVKSISLNYAYSDDIACDVASLTIPKSAQIDTDPEMVQVGGWNAALIRGALTDGTAMDYYVTGSGNTVMVFTFLGETVSMADEIISSLSIE